MANGTLAGSTLTLAMYGAVLSTVVAFWNIRSSFSRVRVTIVAGGTEGDDGRTKSGVYVVVANPSTRPVRVVAAGLRWPYRKASIREEILHFARYRRGWRSAGLSHWFLPPDMTEGLPVTIEPGDSLHFLVSYDYLAKILEWKFDSVGAYVQDALARDFVSNNYKFNSSERKIMQRSKLTPEIDKK